jgi:hypothetical protein
MTNRSLYALFFAFLICAAPLPAQVATPAKEQAPDPLAPIAWLVGGTWSTDVKDATDGHMVHVVNRPAWSDNHQAIIFNVTFDGKPHYYGFYAYNPVTKQIDFYYTSSGGELTTGHATQEAGSKTLRQEFDILHVNGTAGHLRSTIEREGKDAYWLTVFTSNDGTWAQLFRIRYDRKAE